MSTVLTEEEEVQRVRAARGRRDGRRGSRLPRRGREKDLIEGPARVRETSTLQASHNSIRRQNTRSTQKQHRLFDIPFHLPPT